MAVSPNALDWTLVQAFLTVAEEGSLSAAARALGTSQPTLGRHVRQLEKDLECELFQRQAKGLKLTEAGESLLPAALAMREAARDISLKAAGTTTRLEGSVRITASIFTAQHALPQVIAAMRAEEPRVSIELVATDDAENLHFREADIAVRMFRPTQLDIITRHLGDLHLGLFAAKSYLQRRSRPETIEDAMDHDWVGYDRQDRMILGMRARGLDVTREFFGTRCDMHTVNWELVRRGCGLGFAQTHVAEQDPLVEEVFKELEIPPLPVWLAAHESMRHTPRIRWVWDRLVDGMTPFLSPP